MARTSLVIALLSVAGASGPAAASAAPPHSSGPPYAGPFERLTESHFDVANATLGYGPSDKLAACNGALVFVDLPRARVVGYNPARRLWREHALTQPEPCVDGSPSLLSDGGVHDDYAVGVAPNPLRPGTDRLVIIGGPDIASSFVSDDCGHVWSCVPSNSSMGPRLFGFTLGSGGGAPGLAIASGGGLVALGTLNSVGLFVSTDGESWARPQCAVGAECPFAIPSPDPSGPCAGEDYSRCYMLPDAGSSGDFALAGDGTLVFATSLAQGRIYSLALDEAGLALGWVNLRGGGGLGRRVFLRATAADALPGAGCWFSCDVNALDLFVIPTRQNSSNAYATARNISGPWVSWAELAPAPWPPRAGAALISPPHGLGTGGDAHAFLGSGLDFSLGVPIGVLSDLWAINTGVCLLAPSMGSVCAGHGRPDLERVVCDCEPGFSGDFCEDG